MEENKQEVWTEAYAREVLERMEREGKSTKQMAEELGVKPGRIKNWKFRLKKKSEPVAEATFVEVAVAGKSSGGCGAAADRKSSRTFAIHLCGGRKVEVGSGFDASELSRLLKVVEGLPC